MGSLVIEVQYFKTFFMNFKKISKQCGTHRYFLCSKQTFYIIRMPISYSTQRICYFQVYIIIFFFYGYKGQ